MGRLFNGHGEPFVPAIHIAGDLFLDQGRHSKRTGGAREDNLDSAEGGWPGLKVPPSLSCTVVILLSPSVSIATLPLSTAKGAAVPASYVRHPVLGDIAKFPSLNTVNSLQLTANGRVHPPPFQVVWKMDVTEPQALLVGAAHGQATLEYSTARINNKINLEATTTTCPLLNSPQLIRPNTFCRKHSDQL